MTIRALKQDNGKYRVRLNLGVDETGKRMRPSFTADTRREAERQAKEYLDNLEQQRLKAAAGPTVYDKMQEYIDERCNVIRATTLKGYNIILTQYLTELYEVPVAQITRQQVQRWINNLAIMHSAKTCYNAHGLLAAMLKVERPDLVLNTRMPEKQIREIYVPEPSEVQRIREDLRGNPLELPFLLATQCGLRASEISGLRTDCITKDGIPQKYIAHYMGHADTAMIERVYQHVQREAKSKYAAILEAAGSELYGA